MSHKKSKFIEIIIIVGIIVVCVNTGPMLTRIKLKVEYGDYVNISLADVGYHNQVAVIIDECITPATCVLNIHYWFQIEVLSWNFFIKSIVL